MQQHPLETAGAFSLFTWAWLFPLLQAGKDHPLEADDVPPLPHVHKTAQVKRTAPSPLAIPPLSLPLLPLKQLLLSDHLMYPLLLLIACRYGRSMMR